MGGREEGRRGGEGCFDFSNHSIPCPSVPYFKGTLLPHCEHILVCIWCIYIVHCPLNMRGSKQYWFLKRSEINCMMREYGLRPCLSLSAVQSMRVSRYQIISGK